MSRRRKCPNCGKPVAGHPENGCLLAALIGVIQDRGVTRRRALTLHANADVDALWSDLGPVIDRLQDGKYDEA